MIFPRRLTSAQHSSYVTAEDSFPALLITVANDLMLIIHIIVLLEKNVFLLAKVSVEKRERK